MEYLSLTTLLLRIKPISGFSSLKVWNLIMTAKHKAPHELAPSSLASAPVWIKLQITTTTHFFTFLMTCWFLLLETHHHVYSSFPSTSRIPFTGKSSSIFRSGRLQFPSTVSTSCSKPGFLKLGMFDVWGWMILFLWRGWPAHSQMFNSSPGLCPLDVGSNPQAENQTCLWTLPTVPWGQNSTRWRTLLYLHTVLTKLCIK